MPSLSRFLLLTLTAVLSLGAGAADPGAASPTGGRTDTLTSIEVSNSGCYGSCPSYSIALHADGTVVFNGQAFTEKTGEHRKKVDPALFQAIAAKAAAMNLRHMDGNFGPGSASCPISRTDASGGHISAQYKGEKEPKHVNWYSGCFYTENTNLKPVYELATAIANAANVGDWIRKPVANPEQTFKIP